MNTWALSHKLTQPQTLTHIHRQTCTQAHSPSHPLMHPKRVTITRAHTDTDIYARRLPHTQIHTFTLTLLSFPLSTEIESANYIRRQTICFIFYDYLLWQANSRLTRKFGNNTSRVWVSRRISNLVTQMVSLCDMTERESRWYGYDMITWCQY